ncbi:MAG: M67 family metallopeptidase [Planctomycetota bacterium]|nr:M67 family metallopeptidase [Planctomycetota bacterium]MDE1889215.1 M67 family metallopeptidase [Planctomycetota bacterium]MDE2216014.1 M67 family metallopeptidase [Planctomycetota bacterium]
MLCIDDSKFRDIENQVKKSYPLECCGLLIGANTSEKKVFEVRPTKNWNVERAHDRYVIDSKEFNKIDKETRKKGLQIIGIYHSHPDHPAMPSAYDTEHAWAGYSYMIAAIEKGEKIEVRSWIFNEEKKQFEEEKISVY